MDSSNLTSEDYIKLIRSTDLETSIKISNAKSIIEKMNHRFAVSKDKPMIVAKENILTPPFKGIPNEKFPSPWLTVSFNEFEKLAKAMAYVINKRYHLEPQSRVAIIANSLPKNHLLSIALWYLRVVTVEITPKIGNDVKQCWMRMLNMSMGFYDCVFKPFYQDHKNEEEWVWPWIYPPTSNENLVAGNEGVLMVDMDSESFIQEVIEARDQGLTFEREGDWDDLLTIGGTSSSAQAIIKNGQCSEMKFVGVHHRKAGSCYEKYLHKHLPEETNFLLVSPFHHLLGICQGMLHPIYDGGPLIYRTQSVDDVGVISEMLLDDIAEIDVTETLIFSFQFAEWKKLKEAGHPKWPIWEKAIRSRPIGCFQTGGAPPIPEVTKWLARELQLFPAESYGSSEGGVMMYTEGLPPLRGEEGYLKRIPYVDIYLKPLNEDDPNIGEAYIHSAQNFTGYVRRIESGETCENSPCPGLRVDIKADECFVEIDGKKFFKTNDIFRRSPITGDYKFVSRVDDIIAFSTGLKMNPVPFERTMVQFCKNVKLCCLLLDTTGTEAVCFVEPQWENILLDDGKAFKPDENPANIISREEIQHLNELAHTQIWDSIYSILMDDSQSLTNWVKQLTKNNIIIVEYGDKFPTTEKGSLSRRVAKMKYSETLNRISKIIHGEETLDDSERTMASDEENDTTKYSIDSEEIHEFKANPNFSGKSKDYLIILIYQSIKEIIPSTPDFDQFDPEMSFTMYGIDSLSTVKLTNILSRKLKKNYSPSIIFNYASPLLLAQYLSQPTQINPVMKDTQKSFNSNKSNSIAIIGMGLRLPGAINSDKSLWSTLVKGRDCITAIPKDRKLHENYVDKQSSELNMGEHNVKRCGYYDSRSSGKKISQFDAEFFNCLPDEAIGLDPKHRWILETSWEALENAGISPESLENTDTGVFVGIGDQQEHVKFMQECQKEKVVAHHNSNPSAIAGRLSYFYKLYGPSVTVDTACSTGATALHTACRSMIFGDCNLSIVTASKFLFYSEEFEMTSKARMTSPSGRCATFDKNADGYVPAEGCVTFILKRLEDAERDKDHILGVILGTSSGQSGFRQSISVPSSEGQARNIERAMAVAGVQPSDISYIEAHGTGTPYGDAIEIQGINQVYAGSHTSEHPLVIGSIKTNIGHTAETAGLASIAKVLLAMKNKTIPRNLHFKNLNPEIDLGVVPLSVPTHNVKWETVDGKPRTALVSSYGLQGSAVNIILQEYVPPQNREVEDVTDKSVEKQLNSDIIGIKEKSLLTISAKDKIALLDLCNKYSNILDSMNNDESIQNLCYTSNVGRQHFENRIVAVGEDVETLSDNLQKVMDKIFDDEVKVESFGKKRVFKNTGMSFTSYYQQPNLITDEMYKFSCYLYRTQPVYAKALEECDKIITELSNFKILLVNLVICMGELIQPELLQEYKKQVDEDPCMAQFIALSMNYALIKLLEHLSISPNLVVGYKFGEITAALACGKISLRNAFLIIHYICKIIRKNIQLSDETITSDITQLMIIKDESKAFSSAKNNDYSYRMEHSQSFYSSIHQQVFSKGQNLNGDYWVKFVKSMISKEEDHNTSMINQYKKAIEKFNSDLCLFIHTSFMEGLDFSDTMVHCPLYGYKESQPNDNFINIICKLYKIGKTISWNHFHQRLNYETQKPHVLDKVSLPMYPFQRKHFWPM
ncbi:ketoacyl-synt-domain-containing protein [Piromyces finnis]|uniref:Ketoacyl-synt-domain-containing protein n=1 Tax=Piromyces finnis TaxID=1754191 RepID=A0A1Y1V4E4_9FUNG|nr:ketoacyl-synt-domain-containing protein [Piromyces finnis]|eukprot:ORX45632.1 ketoacyl-synt-domain-containing protein [Piromyces finnis]